MKDVTGLMISDGAGNLSGIADVNKAGTLSTDVAVSGTCSISGNGRGESHISLGSSTARYALYMVSGRTIFLVPIDNNATPSVGYVNRQF
jgi:hypothetical protein